MIEQWRPVVGYEDNYEVSNLGNVRSKDRTVRHVNGMLRRLKGRQFQIRLNSQGRRRLFLSKNGHAVSKSVSRLVLEAFVGPPPDGTVACHYDDNPANDTLENLRWDTPSANQFDAVRNGTHPESSKTHCKRGHEFSAENTYHFPHQRHRACRICVRASIDKYQARKRISARSN